MVISIKDGLKLFGISVVFFCAVFVCTFFLNFYIDASALSGSVGEAQRVLYDAQLASAKFTCAITGGVLCVIAVVMTVFYIKLFIDGNQKRFGLLKALGYTDGKIALGFWVFGLSVFTGAALGFGLGYAIMPIVYRQMTVDGLNISIGFHVELLFGLVFAPSLVFAALSCLYARLSLRRSVTAMLKGGGKPVKSKRRASDKQHSFLTDMCLSTLSSKKSAVFFIAFACFCYSAMLQMGLTMCDISTVTMGVIMLAIGIVLGVTALIMAVTTVINANSRNIAVMKAFGYSSKERSAALLLGYVPFAVLGFALGTVYQHILLTLMVNVLFADVQSVVTYSFGVAEFFITLGSFAVLFTAAISAYSYKISKVSAKEIMSDE